MALIQLDTCIHLVSAAYLQYYIPKNNLINKWIHVVAFDGNVNGNVIIYLRLEFNGIAMFWFQAKMMIMVVVVVVMIELTIMATCKCHVHLFKITNNLMSTEAGF